MGSKSTWVCCMVEEHRFPDCRIADRISDLAMLKSKLEEAQRMEGKG